MNWHDEISFSLHSPRSRHASAEALAASFTGAFSDEGNECHESIYHEPPGGDEVKAHLWENVPMFSQPSRCLVHQLQRFLSQVKGFSEPGEGLDGRVAQAPGLTVSKNICERVGETVKSIWFARWSRLASAYIVESQIYHWKEFCRSS